MYIQYMSLSDAWFIVSCLLVQCDPLQPSDNVLLSSVKSTPGDTVQVSCNEGYELKGTSDITCQVDGSWSSDLATCSLG